CEPYLAEAIESVLGQTCPPAEVVIVDDGSTDNTAAIARSFGARVRYEFQEHAGIGPGRNRGAAMATGELMAWLDADDRWVADKLAMEIAVLRENPSLDMVFGQARQLRHGLEWDQGILDSEYRGPELMSGMVPGTMLIKRDSFFRVGL